MERLIVRYAGEKGIVDPTNTPIAGMVATGVRHRAAEAFPWLSRGGYVEATLEIRPWRRSRASEEIFLCRPFVFARALALSQRQPCCRDVHLPGIVFLTSRMKESTSSDVSLTGVIRMKTTTQRLPQCAVSETETGTPSFARSRTPFAGVVPT